MAVRTSPRPRTRSRVRTGEPTLRLFTNLELLNLEPQFPHPRPPCGGASARAARARGSRCAFRRRAPRAPARVRRPRRERARLRAQAAGGAGRSDGPGGHDRQRARARAGRRAEPAPSAIEAAIEIARRLAAETLSTRDLLNEPALVKDYLRRTHGDGTQERTGALYLNARNRLLQHDPEIYRGTLDRAVVEPRELLKRALLANAAALIVYHNHPSGDPSPSREDREFTRRLASAADRVDRRCACSITRRAAATGCVSFSRGGTAS